MSTALAATAGAVPPVVPVSAARLKVITIALILAPLLQVLDTTIVSIALRQMQGELSATQDTSWLVESFIELY